MDSENLRINLKSPIFTDEIVNASWKWTVYHLKNHLTSVYPLKPTIGQQRLIYAGRLLKDDQPLIEVFKKDDHSPYNLHIICSPSLPDLSYSKVSKHDNSLPNTNKEKLNTATSNNLNYFSSTSTPMAMPSVYNSFTPYSSEYYQILQKSIYDSWQIYYQNMYRSLVPNQNTPITHHTVPPNHNYQPPISHYHHPYYSILWQQYHNNNQPSFQQVAPNLSPLRQAYNAIMNNHLNNQQQQPNNANVNNNANANNERGNVDWVDWIYLFFRVVILFSILYFYSSINRFLVVLFFSTLLFLYQAGLLLAPMRQRANEIPNNANPNLNNDNNMAVEENGESGSDGNATVNPNNSPHQNVLPNPEENETSPIIRKIVAKMNIFWNCTKTILFIFVTFFTSLIPDRPPPIDFN
ncbi:unnamed protein product [Gordionus sp. m RMFG-2023]